MFFIRSFFESFLSVPFFMSILLMFMIVCSNRRGEFFLNYAWSSIYFVPSSQKQYQNITAWDVVGAIHIAKEEQKYST